MIALIVHTLGESFVLQKIKFCGSLAMKQKKYEMKKEYSCLALLNPSILAPSPGWGALLRQRTISDLKP
jgi:hypothetical protein